MRRLKLQSAKRCSEPSAPTQHNDAAPASQPATTLEQFKERYTGSIGAVREDRRSRQSDEAHPHKYESDGRRGGGPDHGIKVAQGHRLCDLHKWICEQRPCCERTDTAERTEGNSSRTQERQEQPALNAEAWLQPTDSLHRLGALHISVMHVHGV